MTFKKRSSGGLILNILDSFPVERGPVSRGRRGRLPGRREVGGQGLIEGRSRIRRGAGGNIVGRGGPAGLDPSQGQLRGLETSKEA